MNYGFFLKIGNRIHFGCIFTTQSLDGFPFHTLTQYIIQNPTTNQSLGGMTYFYHADAFQKPPVDYSKIHSPFLVVKGAKDSDIGSCDQFVQKAQEADAPITYFRIDDMDHWIRKRRDVIDESFDWLKIEILLKESP